MVKVRDVADRIVQECFDDDLKGILEANVAGIRLSVKDQLLYHYRHACYRGTEEELIVAIRYQIHNNIDRVLKIKDFYENVGRFVDVRGFQKVKLNLDEEVSTEGRIGNTATVNKHLNKNVDTHNNTIQQWDNSISSNSSGASQTNELHKLSDVIKPPLANRATIQVDKSELQGTELRQSTKNISIENLDLSYDGNPVNYQHFTRELNVNQGSNTNVGSGSTASDGVSQGNNTTTSTRTKGTKTDSSKREIQYVDNEARIKAWTTELPRLKQRFWQIFYGLFRYEHL